MTVSRIAAPRYVHIYRGSCALLLILILSSATVSGWLPLSWGWENGFLENAQAVLLMAGFAYACWHALVQTGSVAALWKIASLFWLAMAGRELAWGAAFLKPMGYTSEGPVISSRVLWYRPTVPWLCAAMLLMCVYWLWRHRVIQTVAMRLWKEHAFPLLSLALFVLAMLVSNMAEGHGFTALARWLEMAQPMVTEELAEFWAYAALWLSQWLLVQHTAAWLRSES